MKYTNKYLVLQAIAFSGVSLFIIKKIHVVIRGYKLTETITTCPRSVVAIPTT
jgi:hypothetical protein